MVSAELRSTEEGTCRYIVDLADVDFAERELHLNDPRTPRASLRRLGERRFELAVTTSGVYDRAEAESLTNQTVKVLLPRLAVYLNTRVFGGRFQGSRIPLAPGDRVDGAAHAVAARSTVPAEVAPQPPREVSDAEWAVVRDAALRPESTLDLALDVYLQGATHGDAIGAFILLYHSLLLVCGDRQAQVDACILAADPKVPTSPSPLHGRPETLYTRLRNELLHIRNGRGPTKTRRAIEAELASFRRTVREVLLRAS